jgi:hypothetical protein
MGSTGDGFAGRAECLRSGGVCPQAERPCQSLDGSIPRTLEFEQSPGGNLTKVIFESAREGRGPVLAGPSAFDWESLHSGAWAFGQGVGSERRRVIRLASQGVSAKVPGSAPALGRTNTRPRGFIRNKRGRRPVEFSTSRARGRTRRRPGRPRSPGPLLAGVAEVSAPAFPPRRECLLHDSCRPSQI